MNKIRTFLSLSLALYGVNAFSGLGYDDDSKWTGFYVGGNAGYLWTSNNVLDQHGVASYGNPIFAPNSSRVAESLSRLGTNVIYGTASGFLGGAQIGYNAQFADNLVLGLDADIDAVGQSGGQSTATNTVLALPNATYNAEIVMHKKLNYLGLLKGRLGVLMNPTVLVYGSGAFAYGGTSMDTSYKVTNSNPIFTPFTQQRSVNKVLAGWASGAGVEWLFAPNWSVKLEYLYYYLGPLHSDLILDQNIATNPPIYYAGTVVYTASDFTENVIKIGINYRFA